MIVSPLRQLNLEVADYAVPHGVALVFRTVLENGFLTGKIERGHTFPEGDHRRLWPEEKLNGVLDEVGFLRQHFVHPPRQSMVELVMAFIKSVIGPHFVIVGAKSTGQVRANSEVYRIPRLADAELEQLRQRYRGREDATNPD